MLPCYVHHSYDAPSINMLNINMLMFTKPDPNTSHSKLTSSVILKHSALLHKCFKAIATLVFIPT